MKIPLLGRRPAPPRVFLALPGPGTTHSCTVTAVATASRQMNLQLGVHTSSLMTLNFNKLWADALNSGADYFCMLHGDINPACYGWLDILHQELHRKAAHLVSCLVPIKTKDGIYSAGIGTLECWWKPKRLFTYAEAEKLPVTFDAADVGCSQTECLLVNDGCWLADLRHPAWRKTDAGGNLVAHFNVLDQVHWDGKKFEPRLQSEDWYFSWRCFELGLRVACTRAVPLVHHGTGEWPAHFSPPPPA